MPGSLSHRVHYSRLRRHALELLKFSVPQNTLHGCSVPVLRAALRARTGVTRDGTNVNPTMLSITSKLSDHPGHSSKVIILVLPVELH